jgi:selenocysteine lyase/cysteine desulfurase
MDIATARDEEALLQERLSAWRVDTPGCASRIHLNNAGAGLMPRGVWEAMTQHLQAEAELGGYEAADGKAKQIGETYGSLGRLLGTGPANIAIVENATVAVAQALASFDFRAGDVIVTTQADYPSNQLMYLSLARRLGVAVRRAGELPEGGADPQSVRELIRREHPRLVSVTWVPTNSGLVQRVEEIGRICEDAGVPYLIDACQAVGQIPIDVAALRCDFLAASARKFLRGPRGIGFLYVAERQLSGGAWPLYLDMRGSDWTASEDFRLSPDARRFENWEFAYSLVLGLGAATAYALEVGEVAFSRPRVLAQYARERLAEMPQLRVLDRGVAPCAIVTAEASGWKAEDVMLELRRRRINTSASLREHGTIDMDAKGASSVLRISPHYYNTLAEIEAAVAALTDILRTPPRRGRS